jgi:hypothetical protein
MMWWIIIGVVIVAVVIILSRVAPSGKVRLADLPALFNKTKTAEKDPSYGMLAFVPPGGRSTDDAINLQFSRANGRVGFDWSLLPVRNVRDKEKFISFTESRGQHPVPMEASNGFQYLRVEDGDIVGLMDSILREFYGITPKTPMDLVYDGFKWP